MFRFDGDVILGIPDDNSGAAKIHTPLSISEISVELNIPFLRAANKLEAPDISAPHAQALCADFCVRDQGLKIRSFTSSIDRYINYAGHLLRQCQRVQVEPDQ